MNEKSDKPAKQPFETSQPEAQEQPEYREVFPVELTQILEAHQKWVASGGKEGKQAKLQGADLGEANLQKANLSEANLYRAYLRKADLSEVDLREADLRKADLRGANLRGAVLTGTGLFKPKHENDLPHVLWDDSTQWDHETGGDGSRIKETA